MNAHCLPEHTPLDLRADAYATIARALAWLAPQPTPPDLADLADYLGLPPTQLQKLFSRWAGVSPKRFLQALHKERALAALAAGADVLKASFSADLSGPGRLHALLVTSVAMTPGELRRRGMGVTLDWGLAHTPFGTALFAATPRGLAHLAFWDADALAAEAEIARAWPAANRHRCDVTAAAWAARVFARYSQPEPVHLFVTGTAFQIQVWQALLRVPEGRLTSYGALAASLQMPTAARAVGSAVGANPIACLIPCHRVIRSTGELGGYRWGLTRKRALLGLELGLDTARSAS
jgi:AraC family transcriptional regulator of adaptative response/methylated-DNA-[protein]-cysteine methyltransferase